MQEEILSSSFKIKTMGLDIGLPRYCFVYVSEDLIALSQELSLVPADIDINSILRLKTS